MSQTREMPRWLPVPQLRKPAKIPSRSFPDRVHVASSEYSPEGGIHAERCPTSCVVSLAVLTVFQLPVLYLANNYLYWY